MCISQKEFDEFVQSFNEDYLDLLKQAGDVRGRFEVLVESFVRLKDLYEVIKVMRETNELEYKTEVLPFNVKNENEFLKNFDFTRREIRRIKRFLKKFRTYMNCEFQEFMSSKTGDIKRDRQVQKAFIRSSLPANFTTNPATV